MLSFKCSTGPVVSNKKIFKRCKENRQQVIAEAYTMPLVKWANNGHGFLAHSEWWLLYNANTILISSYLPMKTIDGCNSLAKVNIALTNFSPSPTYIIQYICFKYVYQPECICK